VQFRSNGRTYVTKMQKRACQQEEKRYGHDGARHGLMV
jgi:hypothetical protein